MAMMAKVHTLEAPRFNLHRPVPRHDHELRYPYDHLKAAQAQDVANIVGGAIVRSEAMKSGPLSNGWPR